MSVNMPNGVFRCPGNLGYMARITNGEVCVVSKKFKELFSFCGITIPYDLRGQYEDAECIRLGNKYFSKAFVEVYYTQQLKKKGYSFVADKIDELEKKLNNLEIKKLDTF
jgi:hypothetical protein